MSVNLRHDIDGNFPVIALRDDAKLAALTVATSVSVLLPANGKFRRNGGTIPCKKTKRSSRPKRKNGS